jgi:hypothetical protein
MTEKELLAKLESLYRAVDAELDGYRCEASTDCCRFGVTGREPYPTAIEAAELVRAVRARGGLPKRRSLPSYGERRCALLGDDGRCVVYASRPFGCRTFFCDRARGPSGERATPPREVLRAFAADIASLASKFAPTDPGPRPLSRVTAAWETDPRPPGRAHGKDHRRRGGRGRGDRP